VTNYTTPNATQPDTNSQIMYSFGFTFIKSQNKIHYSKAITFAVN